MIVLPLIAFVISFFTSQAGISGAFLLLPIQISLLGIASPIASSTNLAYNLIAIPSGIYRYRAEKRFVPALALSILAGSIPGMILGSFIRVKFMPEKAFKRFVGLVLLYFAIRLLTARKDSEFGEMEIKRANPFWVEFEFGSRTYGFPTLTISFLSFLVGIIGGAYGIGGGALITPMLVTTFSLPIYVTASSTLLSTFFSSAIGVISYTLMGYPPNLRVAVLFGLGGMAGIYCGARAQRYVPERAIRAILAVVVLAIALRYLIA